MTTNVKPLKSAISNKINELQGITKKRFGVEVPNVTVVYNLKSIRVAGQATFYPKSNTYVIRLHESALKEYGNDYIEGTVVHEFAHLVQMQHFPGSKPHGTEWKNIMLMFGKDPKRCHTMDLSKAMNESGVQSVSKKVRTVTYKCSCKTHEMSIIRHNRVVAGTGNYVCKECKTRLVKA